MSEGPALLANRQFSRSRCRSTPNPAGDIFWGWLMAQIDLAAGNVAARRARGRCATVSIDRVTFLRPVFIGGEVSLYAEIVRVGRTSLTIAVEAWRRSRDGEEQTKVTEASLVFVALDRGGRLRVIGAGPGDAAARPTSS